jgi:hypothetical protein
MENGWDHIPPILAEDIASERRAHAAASIGPAAGTPAGPISAPAGPARPNWGHTMSADLPADARAAIRIPSVHQLVEVDRALHAFLMRDGYTCGMTSEQEDEFLPPFNRLADALRPIRPFMGSFAGWTPRVDRVLGVICESFDATARLWGWEKVADPEPERSAYITKREEWFSENRERPKLEAAMSIEAGCKGLECPPDIEALADEGRKRGYRPTMSPEQGRTMFPELHLAWVKSPRLGTAYPKIAREEKGRFEQAWIRLHALLDSLPPAAPPAGPPAAPSPSEEAAPSDPPEGEGPEPPGGPGRTPREDRQAARPEAASEQPAPLTEGEPTDPANRSETPIDLAGVGTGGTPRGDRQDAELDASVGKDPPPIDFIALVNALLFQGKPTQAALVRFMADKETATAEEIGERVHGNPQASDKAIGKNARETSDSLAGLEARLSFRFVSGTMFRRIAKE